MFDNENQISFFDMLENGAEESKDDCSFEEKNLGAVDVAPKSKEKGSAEKKTALTKEGKKSAPVKSEQKYPTNATIGLVFNQINLSPDNFDGKEEVTEDEILLYLHGLYPEYSKDTARLIYKKEENLIIPILSGSKKGASLEIVQFRSEYETRMRSGTYHLFDYQLGDNRYRVESTPVSTTVAPYSKGIEGWYQYKLSKIPGIYEQAMDCFFRAIAQKYHTEVLVRIFYSKAQEKYFVEIPRQKVTGSHIEAIYNAEWGQGYYPIADFHSHCYFGAFFSSTDNQDELGNRIYGVYGNYGGQQSEYILRAGTGGLYVSIEKDDIFSMEQASDADVTKLVHAWMVLAFKNVTVIG